MPQRERGKEKEDRKIDRKKEEQGLTPGTMNRHEVVSVKQNNFSDSFLGYYTFGYEKWLAGSFQGRRSSVSEVFSCPGNPLITILEVAHLAFILH